MPVKPPSHDQSSERLTKIIFALAEEVAVLSERLLTQQKLLERKGLLEPDEVQNYEVSDAERAERLGLHSELIERVLAALKDEIDNLEDAS